MRFHPGSVLWLITFDVRLALRSVSSRIAGNKISFGRGRLLLNLFLALTFMHLLGWVAVLGLLHGNMPPPWQRFILNAVMLLSLLTAIGIALAISVNLIFTRGDLDFLCSSPLPIRNVFAARALSVMLQTVTLPAMLFLPAVNMAALYGDLRWLAVYPMTIAMGLIAAATGLLLTLLLVRLIGPRSTRTITLILSVFLGAALFLGLEMPAMFGHRREHAVLLAATNWLENARLVSPDSVWWYPARALQGELIPLSLTLSLSVVYFAATTWFLPRGFAYALRCAAGVETKKPRARIGDGKITPVFWRVLFLKEWRLIWRDPQLLAQLFRQLIFLLPATVIFLREDNNLGGPTRQGLIVCLMTFLAGYLADILSWIAVCAEDAPQLLASAPRSRGELRRTKMVAALLPLWLAACPVVLWLAWQSIEAGLALAISIVGITLSVGVYQLWLPIPGSRTDIRRRLRQEGGKTLGRILPIMMILFGWGGVAWCLPTGHLVWGVTALLVGLTGPAYAWYSSRYSEYALDY